MTEGQDATVTPDEGLDSVLILYATETGTAEDVAYQVSRQCSRIHIPTRVVDMAYYDPTQLISESCTLFIVSTTGAGDNPHSMIPFWNILLRSDLPDDLFDGMLYGVFGLGESGYERFCWPSKRLSNRLRALGGREICERGEGDERDPIGLVLLSLLFQREIFILLLMWIRTDKGLGIWLERLQSAVLQLFPLPPGKDIIPSDRLLPPRISLTPAQHSSRPDEQDQNAGQQHEIESHKATVLCNKRITAEGWFQDVRHFEFQFGTDLK
jgi:sulfite reductase alpha subunit-like flavoprotein